MKNKYVELQFLFRTDDPGNMRFTSDEPRVAQIRDKTVAATGLLCEVADHLIKQYKNAKYALVSFMQLIRQLTEQLIIIVSDEVLRNDVVRTTDTLRHNMIPFPNVIVRLPYMSRLNDLDKLNKLYRSFFLKPIPRERYDLGHKFTKFSFIVRDYFVSCVSKNLNVYSGLHMHVETT